MNWTEHNLNKRRGTRGNGCLDMWLSVARSSYRVQSTLLSIESFCFGFFLLLVNARSLETKTILGTEPSVGRVNEKSIAGWVEMEIEDEDRVRVDECGETLRCREWNLSRGSSHLTLVFFINLRVGLQSTGQSFSTQINASKIFSFILQIW